MIRGIFIFRNSWVLALFQHDQDVSFQVWVRKNILSVQLFLFDGFKCGNESVVDWTVDLIIAGPLHLTTLTRDTNMNSNYIRP
jgi:hypothetical protein